MMRRHYCMPTVSFHTITKSLKKGQKGAILAEYQRRNLCSYTHVYNESRAGDSVVGVSLNI